VLIALDWVAGAVMMSTHSIVDKKNIIKNMRVDFRNRSPPCNVVCFDIKHLFKNLQQETDHIFETINGQKKTENVASEAP
jgi:hypothetical protein